MRDRREWMETSIYTFSAMVLEFLLFQTFPDMTFLKNIFLVTSGIFLFQSVQFLRKKV